MKILPPILILSILLIVLPAGNAQPQEECIPGLVKCSRDGNFICSEDGMSWKSCHDGCGGVCPETYTPNISIEEYIKQINRRLSEVNEGYGFFGRLSGYISGAFTGNNLYITLFASFIILLTIILIYWRRMEG